MPRLAGWKVNWRNMGIGVCSSLGIVYASFSGQSVVDVKTSEEEKANMKYSFLCFNVKSSSRISPFRFRSCARF